MTAALILLAYAAVAATLGRRALAAARWPQHSPGWGVIAWQALSASVAAALLLAGVAVALPFLPGPIATILDADAVIVIEHYGTPVGPWPGLLTLGASLVLAALATGRTARTLVRAARTRRRMRAGLDALGERHPDGYTVLDHPSPLVYCVPGRRRTVVVTRGALDLLSTAELRLVLGHERRHLSARHDVALAVSGALANTFRLGVFTEAHRRIGVLVEMSADDSAHNAGERRVLAGALVSLSSGTSPTPGQTATAAGARPDLDADDAAARVHRLVSTSRPLTAVRAGLVGATAAFAVVLPIGLAMAPAVEAATTGCCATALD